MTATPPPSPPRLLVFAGSTRAQSFNRQLARQVAALATDMGAPVTHLELADFEVPLYNADLEARGTPADVVRLKQLFWEHPAWVICSPEYNGSYTALLKNTLDWVSSPIKGDPQWSSGTRPFAGKVVGLLSASPGALGGLRSLDHLAPLLRNLQCWVAPRQFALGRAANAFTPEGQWVDDAPRRQVQSVIEQVLTAAAAFQAQPA